MLDVGRESGVDSVLDVRVTGGMQGRVGAAGLSSLRHWLRSCPGEDGLLAGGATSVLPGVHIAQDISAGSLPKGQCPDLPLTSRSPSSGFFTGMTREVRGHAANHHAHVTHSSPGA